VKARGSLTTRLARLEDRVWERSPPTTPTPRDEVEWLEVFDRFGEEHLFDHEPDFSKALARACILVDPPEID
jgi:hypothetical protein